MIYSLLLDDRSPDVSRAEARQRVNKALEKPLDPIALEEYERAHWGDEAAEEADTGFWAATTYGENPE